MKTQSLDYTCSSGLGKAAALVEMCLRRQKEVTRKEPTEKIMHFALCLCITEESAWYESTTGHIYLIMGAALAVFLVIIMAMTIFLCRRTRPNKSKGPM